MFAQANFMHAAADVTTFGLTVRGSFESSVTSSFWGHGPVDEFFRATFNKGVQDVLDLLQAFVCTREKSKPFYCSKADVTNVAFGSGVA